MYESAPQHDTMLYLSRKGVWITNDTKRRENHEVTLQLSDFALRAVVTI